MLSFILLLALLGCSSPSPVKLRQNSIKVPLRLSNRPTKIEFLCQGKAHSELQTDSEGYSLCEEVRFTLKDGTLLSAPAFSGIFELQDTFLSLIDQGQVLDLIKTSRRYHVGQNAKPVYSPDHKSFFIFEEGSGEAGPAVDVFEFKPRLTRLLHVELKPESAVICRDSENCARFIFRDKEQLSKLSWSDGSTIQGVRCSAHSKDQCSSISMKRAGTHWSFDPSIQLDNPTKGLARVEYLCGGKASELPTGACENFILYLRNGRAVTFPNERNKGVGHGFSLKRIEENFVLVTYSGPDDPHDFIMNLQNPEEEYRVPDRSVLNFSPTSTAFFFENPTGPLCHPVDMFQTTPELKHLFHSDCLLVADSSAALKNLSWVNDAQITGELCDEKGCIPSYMQKTGEAWVVEDRFKPSKLYVNEATIGQAGGFFLLPGMGKLTLPPNVLANEAVVKLETFSLNDRLPKNLTFTGSQTLAIGSEFRVISTLPITGDIEMVMKLPSRFFGIDKAKGEILKVALSTHDGTSPVYENVAVVEQGGHIVSLKISPKNFTREAPFTASFFPYAFK